MTIGLVTGFYFWGEASKGGVELSFTVDELAGLNQLIKPCSTSLNGL
jgi:hypothetical protein